MKNSSLKIMVSKRMAALLADRLPRCSVYVTKIETSFPRSWADYDGRYEKNICIEYPPEYYSIPRHINTRDLSSVFKSRPAWNSIDEFIAAVADYVAI